MRLTPKFLSLSLPLFPDSLSSSFSQKNISISLPPSQNRSLKSGSIWSFKCTGSISIRVLNFSWISIGLRLGFNLKLRIYRYLSPSLTLYIFVYVYVFKLVPFWFGCNEAKSGVSGVGVASMGWWGQIWWFLFILLLAFFV